MDLSHSEEYTHHLEYMHMAIELAKRGAGKVNPSPLAGAVVVRDDRVLSTGYMETAHGYHAVQNALKNLEDAEGADLYVTLEPCCQPGGTLEPCGESGGTSEPVGIPELGGVPEPGRTPEGNDSCGCDHGDLPRCSDMIIQKGIRRVFIGSRDPKPEVAGRGAQLLREAGLEVQTGILEKECDRLNEMFFHYVIHKTPYVMMKYAMSLDGKIATVTGESQWISSEISRKDAHVDRNLYPAIMVGVGTILSDNPLLSCRIEGAKDTRNPIRVICDTMLRTPLEAQVVTTAREQPTWIATSVNPKKEKDRIAAYEEKGVEFIFVEKAGEHLDLKVLMRELGKRSVDGMILEGGGTLNAAALEAGVVNKVKAYIAPKLLGGAMAVSPIEGMGVEHLADGTVLKYTGAKSLGPDVLLEAIVEKKEKC